MKNKTKQIPRITTGHASLGGETFESLHKLKCTFACYNYNNHLILNAMMYFVTLFHRFECYRLTYV